MKNEVKDKYTMAEAKALLSPNLEKFLREHKAYTAFVTRLKPSHTRVGLKYTTIKGGFPWGYDKKGKYTRNYWNRLSKLYEVWKEKQC